MSFLRKARGRRGETIASEFLMKRGFRILHRNWLCRLGEIDLIVERQGEVRFIEVKYRRTREFGYPEEAINGIKMRHLARTIEVWLEQQDFCSADYQADAIAIIEENGKPLEIEWFEDIVQF